LFGRFWKYENTTVNLLPVDPQQPRLGGSVTASVKGFDVRTFTPYIRTYHGVYGEDFLTFGEFKLGAPDNEEALLRIFEDDGSVVDKHSFKFTDNRVYYSREVNAGEKDTEIEHAIEESELTQGVAQTWTETLFYGAGNKAM
jgi:hypothetical protein